MYNLTNKVIIVTGSSSGIGWGIAQEIHKAGGQVVLHGTNEELLEQRASQLEDRVTWVSGDLSNSETPDRIVEKVLTSFGKLDGLVNNAGIFPRNNIATVTYDDFDKIFAVNCRAPLFMCQKAVQTFKKNGTAGTIVNIGSINAHCGQTDILAYSMSKGALQTMTRNLGDSLGSDNIRVNQLNVGWTYTETEHQTQLAEGRPENWLDDIPKAFAPSGSILRPENIAPHVAFWLSDQSWPVNGQVYEVEQYPVIGRNKINEG
ncbi:SDR family oxidoreductase [Curvivirga sp.]|uniref:SDR family oxidoreductase n=1 Tax=Curvivirga sp. TaxID=2856848 RepID=UPI003B5C9DF0